MSPPPIRWRKGDPDLCARVERAYARALEDPKPIHSSSRRTLHRLGLPPPETDIVLKIYHRRRGLRALRDALKRGLGRSAARREWAALEATSARGLPVPEPLAHGRLATGEEICVIRYVPGRSLLEVLADFEAEAWKTTCQALADSIGALHAAGLRHGDLHAGNLRLGEAGIVVLDLQRTRRLRGEKGRLTDLARLEFSLRRSGASGSMCRSLRSAFGVGTELEGALLDFTRDFQRGRARRHLRVGGAWEHLDPSRRARGLKTRGFDFDPFDPAPPAFASHGMSSSEIRRTRRGRVCEMAAPEHPIIRKEVSAGSWLRAWADLFRGSAGARAFRRAEADRLISDRAAPVLAYLDFRRAGLPVQSWLFLDKVGDEDLDEFGPSDAEDARRVGRALGLWLAEGHAAGLSHRDLKGGNIRIRRTPESVRFWLIDLQDLTGPAHLPESERIEALSQINASVADDAFDPASRMAALEAYAEHLPFSRPLERVAGEIVARSLARRHRWRGEACITLGGGLESGLISSSESL